MAIAERFLFEINPPYEIGTRVKIVSRPSKYRNYDLVGKIGTVRSTNVDNIAILIDGYGNRSSGYGYFYLPAKHITHIDDNNMEEKSMATIITNITNYVNAIKIKFIGDANPCGYVFASFEPELKVGDLVVVKPAGNNMSLARVEEILEGTDYETAREVVCKVDTEAYNERVKIRQQAAELKAKMQERARQLQDIALYQMLAKDDPAMQELLDEYQALGK